MKILKFGGAALNSPEYMQKVVRIIAKNKTQIGCIIISAFDSVTDILIKVSQLAGSGNTNYDIKLEELIDTHIDYVKKVITDETRQRETLANTHKLLNELRKILDGVYLIREVTPKTMDLIMSFGELAAAYIVTQALRDNGFEAEYIDSRTLIKTNNQFGYAHVDFDRTNRNIQKHLSQLKKHKKDLMPIMTGFIGSDNEHETTTLGRGGSDYTASIVGAAIDADKIEIWSDVNGVMTADPKKVRSAFTIDRMSYREAMEMSHFGAKIIHPLSMIPAVKKKIPITIHNIHDPDGQNTIISNKSTREYSAKGISSIGNVSMVLVQGNGMVEIQGVVARLFGTLAKHGINVILITQASSEHTICFAVTPQDCLKAKEILEEEFKYEIKNGVIDPVTVLKDLSIIALVGENMRQSPGIAGTLFYALGKNKINVNAIAQGSSELNISVVIHKKDEETALKVIHKAFFST